MIHGEGWPQAITGSSMLFSGLYEQATHGEICGRITGVGAIPTTALFAGVTKYVGDITGNSD